MIYIPIEYSMINEYGVLVRFSDDHKWEEVKGIEECVLFGNLYFTSNENKRKDP